MNYGVSEIVIEWIRGDSEAAITAYAGSKIKNKVMKLAQESRVVSVIENEDGSIYAQVPVSWIKIQKTREYSEEQKQKMRERLNQNFRKGCK